MPVIVRLFAVAALMAAAGCASGSGGASAKGSTRVQPPELLTRTRPDLVPPRTTSASGRPTTVVELSVLVNADGTPDMNTLKITGAGAADNRGAVTQWVQGLRFKPARRNGEAVAGTFTMSFGAVVRRVMR